MYPPFSGAQGLVVILVDIKLVLLFNMHFLISVIYVLILNLYKLLRYLDWKFDHVIILPSRGKALRINELLKFLLFLCLFLYTPVKYLGLPMIKYTPEILAMWLLYQSSPLGANPRRMDSHLIGLQ